MTFADFSFLNLFPSVVILDNKDFVSFIRLQLIDLAFSLPVILVFPDIHPSTPPPLHLSTASPLFVNLPRPSLPSTDMCLCLQLIHMLCESIWIELSAVVAISWSPILHLGE